MSDKKKIKAVLKAAPAGIIKIQVNPNPESFWAIVDEQVKRELAGRPPLYTPLTLWNKFIEYATWNENNPLLEHKVFGTGLSMQEKKMRAMSIKAFCAFAGISRSTYDRWRQENNELWGISKKIEELIFKQKIEGAAAGLLNSSIISRDLGLVDKTETKTEHSVKQIDYTKYNDEELRLIDELQRKGGAGEEELS